MNTNIERLRKMLDLLALRKRDLAKLTTDLREAKFTLDNLIERKTRLVADINNNQITNQTCNIAIIDANDIFNKLTEEHQKVTLNVEHFIRVISTINIEMHIQNIISNRNV